jgi:ATPase subunit of ABC transporter with duplicated ATPase domains
MEFATGAMSSLLPKLGELLIQEYNLKDSVKKGIGDLKAELESMQGALVKVSSVPLDQLDLQVKIWANEVRELSYAIEDSLDSFLMRVEGVDQQTKPNFKHLLKKTRNKFTKFNARHEIAGDIKDIESQVMKIKERYERYKINDIVANLASTTVDPRLSALYKKVSDLVGIGEPIDELIKVLFEGADTSHKDLNIVSVVGFGGLGKTTLAKALYDKLSKTYECQGFVPVGQNQSAKKVLSDILFELDIDLYRAAERMDERQLINQLQKVLAGKRCT